MSTKHSKAAGKFLENKELAAWHDETLWMVRAKRDKVSKEVPEWEYLRDMASAIKMYSNSHLDQLLLEFEKMPWPTELMYIGRKMPMNIVPLSIIY